LNTFADDRSETARFLEALRDHWLAIAAAVVAGVLTAAAYSMTAPKRYSAHADLLIKPIPAADQTFLGMSLLRDSGDPTRSVITAARLVKSQGVVARVERRLPPELRSRIGSVSVTPVSQADIVTIGASAPTASGAAEIANAFAYATLGDRTETFQDELRTTIAHLNDQLAVVRKQRGATEEALAIGDRLASLTPLVGTPDPTVSVVNRALPPGSPSWPRPILSVVIAFFTSLLIASGGAVALALLKPQISREEELVFGQRLPILARIPRLRPREASGYLAGRKALPSVVWESYRTLRANLANAGPQGGFPETILVTSASRHEGKTLTSVNLAITLSAGGLRVILLDADLRRPMVATVFGVPAATGSFADVFAGRASVAESLVQAPAHTDDLRLLIANPDHLGEVDLLDGRRVGALLARLKAEADIVIVDSPALTEVADALTLADAVDTVLVVVRLGQTRRDKLGELRRLLAQRGITPAGLVVATRERARHYGYADGHRAGDGGYAYGREAREKRSRPKSSREKRSREKRSRATSASNSVLRSLVRTRPGSKPGDV
jgi:receptor protein-tyrosine kinase/non-specific protein-tyrosine kinase